MVATVEDVDRNQRALPYRAHQLWQPTQVYDAAPGITRSRLEPKGKVSLRQFFDQLQYWAPDIEQWIQLEGPALSPIE